MGGLVRLVFDEDLVNGSRRLGRCLRASTVGRDREYAEKEDHRYANEDIDTERRSMVPT